MKNKNIALLFLCSIIFSLNAFSQNSTLVDSTFKPFIEGYGGSANIIVKQPDGKILSGGYYLSANNFSKSGLARFNADGTLDRTFNSTLYIYSAGVRAIMVQPDGKILVGGYFSTPASETVQNIIRLNADGSEDRSFTAVSNGTVNSIVLQPDGKIVIGGIFTRVNSSNVFGSARLLPNGSVDSTFAFNYRAINSIVRQSDGTFIFGGTFTATSPSAINRIAKTNSNGALDTTFAASANNVVRIVKAQPDGRILIGGLFTVVNGVSRVGLARLNADGSLDNTFNAALSGAAQPIVETIDINSAGKIVIGGSFGLVGGAPRNNVAKLNADGSSDNSFLSDAGTDAIVHSVLFDSDESVFVGGEFVKYKNVARYRIAKLNPDASLNVDFNAQLNVNGNIGDIEIQPDGKIIAGGSYYYVNGVQCGSVARFLPDGTIDPTFLNCGQPQLYADTIEKIDVQADGKILVAGYMQVGSDPILRSLVRLNANGTIDSTFAQLAAENNEVTFVKSLPNNQILAAKRVFSSTDKILIRLNSNGSVDSAFNPVFASSSTRGINSIIVRGDGKILVGGYFDTVNGVNRKNLALLNFDGTLDNSFAVDISNNSVGFIKPLVAGGYLIGGSFTMVNNVSQNGLAKISASGQLDASFKPLVRPSFYLSSIAVTPDGRIIVGNEDSGSSSRVLEIYNADGSFNSYLPRSINFSYISDLETQSDGKLLIGGYFSQIDNVSVSGLARFYNVDLPKRTLFDYDGDGRADISVFRPAAGTWYLQQSANGFASAQFGQNGDKIVPADYDGDGKTDLAVFRPGNGFWYQLNSSNNEFVTVQFGQEGDVPIPADFDGDGKADLAVFRPANGVWYRLFSTTLQTAVTQFGQAGDIPQASDYDGDGIIDLTVFRPANGFWYKRLSALSISSVTQFGQSGDIPRAADYDGDGKTDLAVFRPISGTWYLQQSSAGFNARQFGQQNDFPVAADYDGDGRADISVYRPAAGNWFLDRSASGFLSVQFGQSGDLPTPTGANQ